MAKLSKTSVYAIQWLNSQGRNIDQIADELNLTTKQVEGTLEKHSSSKTENTNLKDAKSPASRSQNLMIRETASKKTKNVSIMTKEASELNDQLKNQAAKHPLTEKAIFRPRQK
jgi:hypothetical protein